MTLYFPTQQRRNTVDADTFRRLVMQLLAPVIVIGSKKLGFDLGPIVDSAIIFGAAVYVGFSNWKQVQLSAHAAQVAIAAGPVPAPVAKP